ncbi:MAG TPA: T9SS type A sorting domain-containing protein [Puia sp.]|jgi:hypothetical protein
MKSPYTLVLLMLSLCSYAQTPTINSTYGITGRPTAVVYGNGVYVAAINGANSLATVFTSTDAKIWTPVSTGHSPAEGFSLLAFGNGRFVGVSSSSTTSSIIIYSSTDGANWTLSPANIPSYINDLKFIQGAFYAVMDGEIFKSTDGSTWASFSLGVTLPVSYRFLSIEFGGGEFAIATDIGATVQYQAESTAIYHSSTGEPGSWAFNNLNGYVPFTKLMWLKDRFYLFAGGGFVTSTDAITWGGATIIDTLPDGTVGGLGRLDDPAAFAAGDSVYLMGANFGGGAYSTQVSTDQIHFKVIPSPMIEAAGGLYNNGLYIIYGDGGVVTSSDGIHFKSSNANYTGLASNGAGFVATGNGRLFSSPDFVSWTERMPGPTPLPAINTVLYTGSRYVAAGSDGASGGSVYFSDDGTSWSGIQTPYNYLCMAYGAGRFVAGSTDNPDYMLTSSTDGVNWTVVDTNYTYYYNVRYINNSFFALGISYRDLTGRVMESADGLEWKNITPAAGFPVWHYNDVMYDGTKYYFTGMKKYPDGVVKDIFTLSTMNPLDTTSYGAAGSIVNPAPGTSAGDYFSQFGDFVYHNGQFVGTAENKVNSQAYLLYSADGMSWSTAPMNGPGQTTATVLDGDTYRIVGDAGGLYTVNFSGSPLPVTLLDFEAMAVTSGVGENSRLSWQTGSESNSAYFLVEHSPDGSHWDSIGRVSAAGESAVAMNYQYIQVGPPVGANYYRLGLTDRDGRRQWSPVRKVDIGNEGGIRLYPNPAKGVIRLQLPGSASASLVVYNSAGLPVRQQVVGGYSAELDLGSLATGTYQLVIFQGGKRYSKEFIIAQ